MKVSILIPTLNRLSYLKGSLKSAREQTYENLQILVSDDGSSDKSREYVRAVEAIDNRVRLLPQNPCPGLFENINYLVRHCGSDAFCILGDDDSLSPDFVEKLVQPLLRDAQVALSFCDHWLMDGVGKLLEEETERHAACYGRLSLPEGEVADPVPQAMIGSVCMGFSLYRASVFGDELFDLSCGGAADFDYAIRAAQLGKLYYVKERLGTYRVHPATATATRPAYMINGIIRVYSKHSFQESRHEKIRRDILNSKYCTKALFTCVLDRREWLHSVASYLKNGGKLFNPRIALSLLLVLLPQFAATKIKSILKNVYT